MRWILTLIFLLSLDALAQELDGTYRVQGAQGLVTLQIKGSNEGILGTLRGGSLSLRLQGFPREDGSFLGAATNEAGEFASYFLVSRASNKVFFDLVESDADGDPDFTATKRITFSDEAQKIIPSGDLARTKARQLAAKSPPKTAKPRAQSKPGSATVTKPATKLVAQNSVETSVNGSKGGADWKTFRHATGLMLRYPPSWTVQKATDMLLLTPPGQAKDANGPLEIYSVKGETANGINDPLDPQVGSYLDSQMAQLAPFLTRQGEPKPIRAATTNGALYSWTGTNPNGVSVRANVRVAILKGFAIAMVSLGEPSRIARREELVQGIFSSFAAGAGQRDARIVGAWKFWGYKSSADGRYGVETKKSLRLLADGTALWGSATESSGSFSGKDAGGNTTWTGGIASQNNAGDRGTWSAGDGELFIQWNNGTMGNWDYRVQGQPGARKLFLTGSKPQPEEWMEEN